MRLRFLSLFAGIGGIDLGLDRAGMTCVGQVEREPFCLRVLAKHWPDVRRFNDVRELVAWMRPPRRLPVALRAKAAAVREWATGIDLIAGGFPCQDISNAGKRVGIGGAKSGLWSEFRRLIGTIRPRLVLVENVSALLVRGIDRVLGDLAACGYDASWDCVPAAAVGAPHIRDRLFIVAHACEQAGRRFDHGRGEQQQEGGAGAGDASDADERGRDPGFGVLPTGQPDIALGGGDVADADSQQHQSGSHENRRAPGPILSANHSSIGRRSRRAGRPDSSGARQLKPALPHAVFSGLEGHERGVVALADYWRHNADPAGSGWWSVEPALGRVADGVPNRVDRLRAIGNAVVPQVAEWIGRRIMARIAS